MSKEAEPRVSTPFFHLVQTSAAMAKTASRLEKKRLCVEQLAAIDPQEVAAAVGWLVEKPLCGPLGIGPTTLRALSETPVPAAPSLSLREVEDGLEQARVAGREGAGAAVSRLFAKLTAAERAFMSASMTGNLRQGSLGGVMLLALAALSGKPESSVRHTVMVAGSVPRAADVLFGPNRGTDGPEKLELFRPLSPMLAAQADSLEEALAVSPEPRVEWKVDGIRAQIHKRGSVVIVYSRQGLDITSGCGPLLPLFARLRADSVVLDGELFLLGPNSIARPFQDSFSALSGGGQGALYQEDRICVYFFDCMHRDGRDLLEEPLAVRVDSMRAVAREDTWIPQISGPTLEQARQFYEAALSRGHEGVMVKDPASPYRFGGRGLAWQKVKESRTVDLSILAAEWGSGRRTGYLSNLHLGARRNDGTFCMVGKTFKGLTDAMLHFQTARLLELETERMPWGIRVKPDLVVEIRYNDVQRSPRYPGGIALRFARVVRYRKDKTPAEVSPLESLSSRLPAGFAKAGRGRSPRGKGAEAKVSKDDAHEGKPAKAPQLSLFDD